MKKRLKVGFFSFTCCEGCTIVFIEILNKRFEQYMEKIEIVNFRQLRTVKKIKPMDMAFIEGAISTESEIKKLKEIRANAKKLIALGSGASNGYPSNQRNSFPKNKLKEIQSIIKKMHQIDKILPIKEFVKVDDTIDGCPVDQNKLMKKIDGYLGVKNA